MSDTPDTYPTTSDICQLMKFLNYAWSNEAQTYFNFHNFDLISDKGAKTIYSKVIGNIPFEDSVLNKNTDTCMSCESKIKDKEGILLCGDCGL